MHVPSGDIQISRVSPIPFSTQLTLAVTVERDTCQLVLADEKYQTENGWWFPKHVCLKHSLFKKYIPSGILLEFAMEKKPLLTAVNDETRWTDTKAGLKRWAYV